MLQDTLAREVELKVVVLFAFFLAGYSPVKFKPIVVVTYMAVTMNFEWCLLYTVKLQVSNSACHDLHLTFYVLTSFGDLNLFSRTQGSLTQFDEFDMFYILSAN